MHLSLNLLGTTVQFTFDGDAVALYVGPPIEETVEEDQVKEAISLGGSFEIAPDPEDEDGEELEDKIGFGFRSQKETER